MTLFFIEGVDDDMGAYKWTSGYARRTDFARTGTSSIGVGASNTVFGAGYTATPLYFFQVAERHATVIAGFGIRLNALTNTNIFYFTGVSANHAYLRRTSTGGLTAHKGDGTLLASSATGILAAGTWYFIEAKIVVDDTTGSFIVKLNGQTVINFTGDTRNGQTDALIYQISYEFTGGSSNTEVFWIDDIYFLNGAGSVNNNFIGDCKVLTLYPNGNGNYSQGVGSDGNSVDNYLLVDEPGTPNTSDYVAFANTGDKDTYTFEDLPAGTVYGIAQRAYASKSDAGSRTMRNIQRIAGTDYASAVDQGLSVTPTYLGKSDLMQVSPATAVLWTVAEINAAEFGVEARA